MTIRTRALQPKDVLSAEQVRTLRELPLVLGPREVAPLLDIGTTLAYDQCRAYLETKGATGIPCRRVGQRIIISKIELLQWLGATLNLERLVR